MNYNFIFIISQLSNNNDNNIMLWNTARTILTLFLCVSCIYFDTLRDSLINKLINYCWYRIDNNADNNIYLKSYTKRMRRYLL